MKTLQNYFETKVAIDWAIGTGKRYVTTLPTPTSGWLVVSPNNSTLREIVAYDVVGTDGTGNFVTLTARGVGGTTEQTHSVNEAVNMNITAQHWADIYVDPVFTGNVTVPTPTDGTDAVTKDYADGLAISGAPDAGVATKGIGKTSVAPASASNPIFVGDNDPRVPTQSENDALVGTSGTPSTSNKYVTDADTTGTGSVVRNSVLSSYAQGVISYTAGESISAGQAVYLKVSDGKVYRTSPVQGNETLYNFIGIASNAAVLDGNVNVQTLQGSLVGNQSFGSKTSSISSTAFFDYSGAGGSNQWEIRSGAAANQYAFVIPNNVNNIEKIEMRGFNQFGSGGGNVILRLYKPTLTNATGGTQITPGTQVASVTLTSISTNTSTFSNVFTFSSPVTVTPGEWYSFALEGQSGGGGNSWYAQMVSGSYAQGQASAFFSAGTGFFSRGLELGLKVYTTSNFNYETNDNVFLNGSTGGVSTQWGTNVFPVGRVKDASSFILDTSIGTKLINTTTPNIMTTNDTPGSQSSVIVIPKNARRMVLSIGYSFKNIFDINLSDVVTDSPIFGYTSEEAGTTTTGSLRILRNQTCANVNLAVLYGNLALDSGTYVRFYN